MKRVPEGSMIDMFANAPTLGTHHAKLSRRAAPATSKAAAQSLDTKALEQMVADGIAGFGQRGCTSDELRAGGAFKSLPYSSVTARYAALIEKGIIVDTGEKRRGSSGRLMRVMRRAWK
ncbi:hypothetical protein UFOVP1040_28 [uncultured Caudovirales phage]|uniref:Uncharacterized protein n=1 Tax=uncultured Caudovirales phage TaxID=2100421 RepID=A0A6J5QG45_9CAUD|nr:hypothetical protein UFOVP1040_28 [uncultured Caudovirales phage]